jgi:predicted nucleic acid-binding Zn ribbon protein
VDLRDLHNDISRRQRHLRGPQKMADVLSGLFARRGYAQVQAASTCERAWRESVGEKMAKHSRPGNVRRGVLEVTVRNSAVMQELTFQKQTLLAKITGLLPDQKIRDLKFRVGPVE